MVKDQEVLFIDGPWLKVSKNGEPGWIHGDYVTEVSPILVADTGLPTFVVGQPNPTNGANTLKVREIIKDIFGLGKSGDCLNCTEYATYRIKTKLGIDISWPVTSGRNGGRWGVIFQTAELYNVLAEPKTNCAMCFTSGISNDPKINEIGHVAFVEEVLSDGSIKISEANWPHNGIYNERVIPKEKWQNQYKAQFVDFV